MSLSSLPGTSDTRGEYAQSQVFCRLDDHLATPAFAETARRESIYKGEKFSDHAPVTIEYDYPL